MLESIETLQMNYWDCISLACTARSIFQSLAYKCTDWCSDGQFRFNRRFQIPLSILKKPLSGSVWSCDKKESASASCHPKVSIRPHLKSSEWSCNFFRTCPSATVPLKSRIHLCCQIGQWAPSTVSIQRLSCLASTRHTVLWYCYLLSSHWLTAHGLAVHALTILSFCQSLHFLSYLLSQQACCKLEEKDSCRLWYFSQASGADGICFSIALVLW